PADGHRSVMSSLTAFSPAARRGYAAAGFGQLHFREMGTGEPLLLLHKTPSSSIMYCRVLPLLGQRYRAIAIDTPGFGMSDPPPPDVGINFYAQAFLDAMDSL